MGFGKDGKGIIIYQNSILALGTLADGATLKASTALTLEEDFRLIKTEHHIVWEGHTQDENPILLGIADNNLSAAEIAEALTSSPANRNDNVLMAQALRPVWDISQVGDTPSGVWPDRGDKLEKTIRWTFSNPNGWTWFAHNISGAALTIGTIVNVRSKHFGVWVS